MRSLVPRERNKPTVHVRLKRRKERKVPVALEIIEPATLSTMLKPFFTQKLEKSVEAKTYSRNIVKVNSFRAGHIFFLVPFKESRFPLFGISIHAGKRSSRSITKRSCATGIDFFHNAYTSVQFPAKTLKSSMQPISWV